MIKNFLLITLVILASTYMVSAVQAQDDLPHPPSDDEVNAIAKNLYCPVCPNTPLDVCETQACEDWREQIRTQLANGWSEDQIIDYFVEQYGERVLAEPRRQGFSSLVWVFPVVLFILGLGILWQVLTTWQTKQQGENHVPVMQAEIEPEILETIEKEIRSLD